MTDDVDRMLICSVCGKDACFGFNLSLDGILMGDVGDWRCADHHASGRERYTRERWAEARALGLYPEEVAQADEAA
jgi:hypothetical protein